MVESAPDTNTNPAPVSSRKQEEEVELRLISVHGDILDLDEVIDNLIGKKDKNQRRFSTL